MRMYVDVEHRPADCIRTEYWQQQKKAINFDSVNNNSFFFSSIYSTEIYVYVLSTLAIYFPPGEIIQT